MSEKFSDSIQNFCTLFDSFYLSRGLAMYESLETTGVDFHLYVFTFDDLCFSILESLNLKHVTLIPLSEFENTRLLNVKHERTKAEYCWTCTSSTIEYILDKFRVTSCTYIDADLFFYSSPLVLKEELDESKSVLITEHRYSWLSKIYEEKRAGKFCVQYITFGNNNESRLVLSHWIDQCIEWCFGRYEDGRFGDQKYLDEWPSKYLNIKISDNPGAGVAPWNISRYNIVKEGKSLLGIEKRTQRKFDIIFYHFHFVRFLDNGSVDLGWNSIPRDALNLLYYPYIKRIVEIEKELQSSFSSYKTSYYGSKPVGFRAKAKYLIKVITKYNLLSVKNVLIS